MLPFGINGLPHFQGGRSALGLTAGHRHESPVGETVFAQVPQAQKLTPAIMAQGDDSDEIREQLCERDLLPGIPPKSNRKVDRFCNQLKQFRRIATRYEQLSRTLLALIHLVAVGISVQ
jgi:hypothetical protein